jgi:hypothetical protein
MMRFLAAAAIFLAASPAVSEDGRWQARITSVKGEVIVYPPGSQEGIHAEPDTPLEVGDLIITGDDSLIEIALEAESVLDFGEDSFFEIEALDVKKSVFEIFRGSLVAKIKSLVSREGGFEIRTPTVVAAVRGTEFGVEVEEAGHTHVGVFDEGKVGVRHASHDKSQEHTLGANDETRVQKGSRRVRVARLERFKKHRGRIKNLRARRAHLRRNWTHIPHEKRAELRGAWKDRFAKKLEKMPSRKRKAFKDSLHRGKREAARKLKKSKKSLKRKRGKSKKTLKKGTRKGQPGKPKRGRGGRRGERGR